MKIPYINAWLTETVGEESAGTLSRIDLKLNGKTIPLSYHSITYFNVQYIIANAQLLFWYRVTLKFEICDLILIHNKRHSFANLHETQTVETH